MLDFCIVQGARPQNEDRTSSSANVFSVHDGHGGAEAVDKLVALMSDRDFSLSQRSVGPVQFDPLVLKMADLYYEMLGALSEEASGAVSVSVLCAPSALYFGWVGDCQGCVFDCLPCLCEQIDFVEPERAQRLRQPITSPHCFLSEPFSPMIESETLTVERDITTSGQAAVRFKDPKSQIEYQKVLREHPDALIDSTVVLIGDARLLVDSRISCSIQPTRALGDCDETMALRHPTVMRVQHTGSYKVLLCSDGAFSRGAFADIRAVCSCVLNPLNFVRANFYRRGQELTERLAYYGKPPHFRDWAAFLLFLRTKHLPALRSERFFATFEDYENSHWWLQYSRSHTEWLLACNTSIKWLEENPQGSAAHIAAHLAVVMGSTDNVSVLVKHKL